MLRQKRVKEHSSSFSSLQAIMKIIDTEQVNWFMLGFNQNFLK
jgi:hypothetical protein